MSLRAALVIGSSGGGLNADEGSGNLKIPPAPSPRPPFMNGVTPACTPPSHPALTRFSVLKKKKRTHRQQ